MMDFFGQNDSLEVRAASQHSYIREGVASDPTTPSHILMQMLAAEQDLGILVEIVKNPNLPKKELVVFSAKEAPADLRMAAASNRSMPVRSLCRLAKDEETSVRIAATQNPMMPEDKLIQMFEKAVADQDDLMKQILLASPNLPTHIKVSSQIETL